MLLVEDITKINIFTQINKGVQVEHPHLNDTEREVKVMSERERMYQLLDTVPDNKIAYIIGFIQGLTIEDQNIPNSETLDAMQELENGGGESFDGSTADFLEMMLED